MSILYTAVSDGYDRLFPAPGIAFLERPQSVTLWDVRDLAEGLPEEVRTLDANRRAKWYKLHPHRLFPQHEVSLWIDGSVQAGPGIAGLMQRCDAPWMAFPHHSRRCILAEDAACAAAGKDDPALMLRQVATYLREWGYPRDAGLTENTVLLRRHHDPRVIAVNELWWQQILQGSKRDQLSLGPCCRRLSFEIALLPGTVYSNPWLTVRDKNSRTSSR